MTWWSWRRAHAADAGARLALAQPCTVSGSCQEPHLASSWRALAIRMDDGSITEYTAGDVKQIEPGHDAWVVGDEPVILLEWETAG